MAYTFHDTVAGEISVWRVSSSDCKFVEERDYGMYDSLLDWATEMALWDLLQHV